jgi:phage N-6-adenine-methyltransferase
VFDGYPVKQPEIHTMTHQSQSPARDGARQDFSTNQTDPASTQIAAKTQAQTIRTMIDGGRAVEQFDPERYRLNDKALDFGIEEAKRIKDWPALEQAVDIKIAESHKFVAWWKANVTDKGGRPVAKNLTENTVQFLPARKAEELTGMRQQRVSDLRGRLADENKFRLHLLGTEYRAACLEAPDRRADLHTGEMEWYTPTLYIEKARRVLGDIDLDPASCAAAQEIVKAAGFYTVEDDGLKQKWRGRVWLNPPYAGALIAEFAEKMVASWNAGELVAAFMLTNAYPDTSWWHALAAASNAVCFTRGRIKFESPYGEKCAPTNGQSFFYFGTELERLREEFSDVGLIMVRLP